MRWAEAFIAVDWGTTNRRAYRIDESGECAAEFEDDRGILSLAKAEIPAEVEAIRARLGDLPLLLAGMIGSRNGWVEAPYAPCPASIDDLAARLIRVDDRTAIVPGLSVVEHGRADVMRGEEVQMFGAHVAELIPATCLVCHPGTHNKWIRLDDGRITSFRTVMTGELFNLLRGRGALAELIGGDVSPGEAFRAGVKRGSEDITLTAELFTVRAQVLLDQLAHGDAASFTSGLLIGTDIRLGLGMAGAAELIVMGRPELTGLYAAALAEAGRVAREVDGEAAFLAGATAIAKKIR